MIKSKANASKTGTSKTKEIKKIIAEIILNKAQIQINMEICPKCGLPKQACVCEQIVKSSQKIKVTTEKKRYGKIVTVVTGFDTE